jgi:hypothetical protein
MTGRPNVLAPKLKRVLHNADHSNIFVKIGHYLNKTMLVIHLHFLAKVSLLKFILIKMLNIIQNNECNFLCPIELHDYLGS